MSDIELSIVMPCLNEELTLGVCIDKATDCMRRLGVLGEVIVADNGSSDRSISIASDRGARVVNVETKGYGAALMGGFLEARGEYIIMADADDSYDFSALDAFIDALREGSDLVVGNRFKGGIADDAMPWLHKYVGNPILSLIGRLFFDIKVRDFHCGLRGFRRERLMRLGLQCTGMEFASEMVVKAGLAGYMLTEVPTTLVPDGRDRPPHLRSFRDGWRHLQFLLLYSPRWLFFYPGSTLFLLGAIVTLVLAFGPMTLGNITLDIHTMLYGAGLAIVGLQMLFFSEFMQLIGQSFGRLPSIAGARRFFTIERGLGLGFVTVISGLLFAGAALWQWRLVGFSSLEPDASMRETIASVTLIVMGVQIIISSFFLGAIQLFQHSRTWQSGEGERAKSNVSV